MVNARYVPGEPDAVARVGEDVAVDAGGFQARGKWDLEVHGGLGAEHDVASQGIPVLATGTSGGLLARAAARFDSALGRGARALDVEAPQVARSAQEEAVRNVPELK